MQLYSAIDLHSNNSVIAVIDQEGKSIINKRVPNDLAQIIHLLLPFKDNLIGTVVESTYNWYWLVNGLIDAGFTTKLANTTAIQQYSGKKYTDDFSDAAWLAELLRLNILPTGYIYPKEQRALRDLARKRLQLVHQKTRNLLSLQTLITRETSHTLNATTLNKLDEEQLKSLLPDNNVYLAASANWHLVQHIAAALAQLEKTILGQIKLSQSYQGLLTVPGVGKILGITIMLETGDIHRFPSVGNFASYCRCVKSECMSNGKKKGENNRKNGNKYLCWAFIEAAHYAIRYYPEIKKFYQKKAAKKNTVLAIKAVSHKLARASYYVLKNGVDYDMNKAFY